MYAKLCSLGSASPMPNLQIGFRSLPGGFSAERSDHHVQRLSPGVRGLL
jgi:hypothetical protein